MLTSFSTIKKNDIKALDKIDGGKQNKIFEFIYLNANKYWPKKFRQYP